MDKNTFRKYKYYIFSLIFIGFAISFIRTATNVTKNKKRLDELRNELTLLQQERKTLGDDIEYQKTNEYIEQEARNKLNLIKPTETVYVVDPEFSNYINQSTSETSKFTNDHVDGSDSYISAWLKLIF